MQAIFRVAMLACLSVIVYDTLAATASRQMKFYYGHARSGSWIIYAATAFFAAKAHSENRLLYTLTIGFLVGFVDSTIGWYVSSLIGPGRPGTAIPPILRLTISMRVSLKATAIALLGGLVTFTL